MVSLIAASWDRGYNTMKNEIQTKGTWIARLAIRSFTIILGILIYWFLGFLVEDIESIPGPDYAIIEKQHLNATSVTKEEDLSKQINELSHQIDNQTEKQKVIGDSNRNLQETMAQLIELKKLAIEKGVTTSDTEQTNFTKSLNLFFENQKKYQDSSQTVSEMLERKQQLVREKEQIEQELEKQRRPAREEYEKLIDEHLLKLAFFQLAILLPILLIAALVLIKKRGSIYFPLFLAFGVATLLKVTFVINDYFPSRYFKYLFIISLLIIVGALLIHFIRAIAFPKIQSLMKQYREGYERFLCPACEYPIRTGPRRYLFWSRRTVNKIVVPAGAQQEGEECYTCPCCGSALFELCSSCQKIRHAMLPHCSHCGAENKNTQ